MQDHFRIFARYNRWANERLYRAALALSEDDFRADLGAFFGSVCGTLNHLLVADRIWLRRLTGEGPIQTRLDEIVSPDGPALWTLREAEDARLIGLADSLDDAALAAPFTYRTVTNPAEITQSRASALVHIFNHQTHHRGQATALLTRLAGRDAVESLDYLMFQRLTGIGLN